LLAAMVAPIACCTEVLAMVRGPSRAAIGVALFAFVACIAGAIACAREKRRDDERTHLIAHAGVGIATLCAVLVVAFAVPLLAFA
jgi:hypothetical protein